MIRSPVLRAAAALSVLAGWPISAGAQVHSPSPKAGILRQLVCRGKADLDLRFDRDPSPRDPRYISMVLTYTRSSATPGLDYKQLEPGSCTWNPGAWPNYPVEPGVVYFDLPHEAQPWSAPGTRLIDTSITAAEHWPDLVSYPRYIKDPTRLWVFYADDVTNISISHGPLVRGPVRLVSVSGSRTAGVATLARTAELLCRGGHGLSLSRGGNAGSNLVVMSLSYTVNRRAAGQGGQGLANGTCAWTDRTGMRAEPGQIRFVTAGNAQLKQSQSGSPVDRSPTAAERWPDINTIPAYLLDPAHYWTFTVATMQPDSAKAHEAFKPSTLATVTGPVSSASPQRSAPISTFGGARTPGAGTTSAAGTVGSGGSVAGPRPAGAGAATSNTATLARAPVRLENVGMVLDRFTISFSGRPNASPTVVYHTQQPTRDAATGRWVFPSGAASAQVAGGSASGFRATYSAWSTTPPARGQLYHYIITVPATAGYHEEQLTGQFTTLSQHVRVVITRLDLISTDEDELGFKLFATSPGLRNGVTWGPVTGGPGIWKLGSHSVDGEVSVSNAPDSLSVFVYGTTARMINYIGENHTLVVQILDRRSFGDRNQNAARRKYFIGTSPTERFLQIPFVIRSLDGFTLMFEAHGLIQVTRK